MGLKKDASRVPERKSSSATLPLNMRRKIVTSFIEVFTHETIEEDTEKERDRFTVGGDRFLKHVPDLSELDGEYKS